MSRTFSAEKVKLISKSASKTRRDQNDTVPVRLPLWRPDNNDPDICTVFSGE